MCMAEQLQTHIAAQPSILYTIKFNLKPECPDKFRIKTFLFGFLFGNPNPTSLKW